MTQGLAESSQDQNEFRRLLMSGPIGEKYPPVACDLLVQFYAMVVFENHQQNLTRLLSPLDFYQGHVLDVLEWMWCLDSQKGWRLDSQNLDIQTPPVNFGYPIVDLGSGVGVPGVIVAILTIHGYPNDHLDIQTPKWILTESEVRKTEFLGRAVGQLGLDNQVSVHHGRAEQYLATHSAPVVMARAVGTVEKIYSWIRQCSTWNILVLFKGPGWSDEWAAFQGGRYRRELSVELEHGYFVGEKTRKIVVLRRVPQNVPRGTMKK
jgi:16S rRNA G527 N7-methylase RsmG